LGMGIRSMSLKRRGGGPREKDAEGILERILRSSKPLPEERKRGRTEVLHLEEKGKKEPLMGRLCGDCGLLKPASHFDSGGGGEFGGTIGSGRNATSPL